VQRAKNLVLDLLFSAGTPMLLGGDELLRTQRGNNNAYCQDNAISWFDWKLREKNAGFFEFVKNAIAFTRRYPVLQRRTFFTGRDINADQRPDIKWYGFDLDEPRWHDPELRTVAYQLDGAEADRGAGDYLVFVILNADWNPCTVRIPPAGEGRKWHRVVDTSRGATGTDDDFRETLLDPDDIYLASPRSTIVLLARRA
jgi:glycogen operon protein